MSNWLVLQAENCLNSELLPDLSHIILYQILFKFKLYSNLLVLMLCHPKIIDKTNGIIYQSLTDTTIHMHFESWIRYIVIHSIDSPM
jgi:hypothetical protein